MISVDASASLMTAVRDYFNGERSEMLLILGGSALLCSLAAWLWMSTRSSFSIAFMVTVLSAAALLSATAASLLVRDTGLSSTITQGIASPHQDQMLSKERHRIELVVSKYRYYRYGAAALAALSVLGLLFTHRGWVHGVAAGLLLLVATQVVIDHFSEKRAQKYLTQLSPSTAGRQN